MPSAFDQQLPDLTNRQRGQLRWSNRALVALMLASMITAAGTLAIMLWPRQTLEDAIIEAVRDGDVDTVREVLAREPKYVQWQDPLGVTFLHRAARDGHTDIAIVLLDAGADPLATAYDIDTSALHLAAGRERLAIIRLLVQQHDVDVNLTSGAGFTPLHTAAAKGQAAAAALLIELGADINAATPDGVTPLHAAAVSGETRALAVLFDRGADLDARTTDQTAFTPLHTAVFAGRVDVIDLLLQQGADPLIRDAKGRNAVTLARDIGRTELADDLSRRLQQSPQ